MASSIKLFLMLTIVVVNFENDVHGATPSPSSTSDVKSDPDSKSASSPSSSSSDLFTEYILRDLLRSATKSRRPAMKHNTNPKNMPVADAWISAQRPTSLNRYSDVEQADDVNDESQPHQQQPLVDDQDDQQKLFNYALWLLQQQQPQADTEYEADDGWENYGQPQLKQPAPIQSTMQDLSWFDGPVSPKVSPMVMDLDENNNGNYYKNNMMVDVDDNNDDETENQNLDAESEALLNSLWIKYLANLANNNNNDDTNDDGDEEEIKENVNVEDQDTMMPDVDYSDLDRLIGLNQMIEKRRQKVIKHEDIRRNVEPTTTQKPLTTTMTSLQENHHQRQPTLSLDEKAKFLHKATMFNQNDRINGNHQHSFRKQQTYHPIKIGQKEYPMLRPALDSNTKSNQDPNNGDWPSELDENTMAEEESLKQLPKQQQQQQQIARRQIRDVLASQLDSLKQQDKDSGVGSSNSSSNNNNNNNNKTQTQH